MYMPQSILEVFIICLAGFILAQKGILDRNTQKVCPLPSFFQFGSRGVEGGRATILYFTGCVHVL